MFLKLSFLVRKFKKMSGFEQFESYKYLQNLTFDELKLAVNYICSNLNSYPCHNYHYWYDMYCYTSKTFTVMNWRKERGFKEVGRLGLSPKKFLQLNYNNRHKLEEFANKILPFFKRIQLNDNRALEFFHRDYE